MSKRMIDSEVSDKLRYRYDPEIEETYLDIENVDNLDVNAYMRATGLSMENNLFVGTETNTNTLTVRSPSNQNAFNFDVGEGREWMKGRQIANNQLYYHCVKLTSATKTVYVNIYSKVGFAVDDAQGWVNVIMGSKVSPNDIDWYYGTDGHVVHSVWKGLINRIETTIDGEEVTGYEGHVNGLYFDKLEVVE